MNKEIMGLPEEIEKYKNDLMPLYWKVPQKIIHMWNSYIEPTNLYGSEENGAYAYAKGRRLSEDSLIYLAVQADAKGHTEMANGFWKLAYHKSKSLGEPLSTKKKKADSTKERYAESKVSKAALSLQEWRFALLRQRGKYSCYCIFLALPSDKEVLRYLTELSDELKIISSSASTLVVALGSIQHLRSDVDAESWSSAIKDDIQKGYSVQIARLFGLNFTAFPCLVVFKNLNSSEHNPISLKDMTAEEIAGRMRWIFHIIDKAVREKKSPLEAIQRHGNDEQLRNAGKSLVIGIRNIAGTSLRAAIEAWVNAQINKQ
jgi:hypothetical protein